MSHSGEKHNLTSTLANGVDFFLQHCLLHKQYCREPNLNDVTLDVRNMSKLVHDHIVFE